MKNQILFSLAIIILHSCSMEKERIELSGSWNVQADSISKSIQLPGSLSENGIGEMVRDSATNMLSEQIRFVGKAIYEREIEVPAFWKGQYVELYMERTKISEVSVNGTVVGSQNSASAPHIYLLKDVFKPGKNKLTITVDNTKNLSPFGSSHVYSEHTQTNWNGVLGEFYLRRLNNMNIRDAQIYAMSDGSCRLKIKLLNTSPEQKSKQQIKITVYGPAKNKVLAKESEIDIQPGISEHEVSFSVQNPELWDEYNPYLYSLDVQVPGAKKETLSFGFRQFEAKSRQFTNNGRVVFLRGTHEGGVFPITGYASMKKEDWTRYFGIVKSYGINHVRFHSWTPPLAAFEAADESGVFIQPELPFWSSYPPGDTTLLRHMKEEGEKIMQAYGNHPSFVMFTLGNELNGDSTLMVHLVDHLKAIDNRHLYAMGSNNFFWDSRIHSAEDFFVSMRNGKEVSDNSTDLRGSFSFADSDGGGIINGQKPNTVRNFANAIQNMDRPAVGHETGQYQIYPNYGEIEKYTGVLQARNFTVFRNRLEKAGMLSQADQFLKASGALSALCYREEIEMALRTPDFGGFQLLDLKDYPGQGTALVGILDVFLDSKGVISKEKWTEFCNDVVPLACFPKYCWTNDEQIEVSVEVANYGKSDLINQTVHCTLKDKNGSVLFEQSFSGRNLAQGVLTRVEKLKLPRQRLAPPQQLILSVELPGTSYTNSWNIWVYPSEKITTIREGIIRGVLVTRNKKTFEAAGDKDMPVLYIPDHKDISGQSVGGLFITDFWNYGMFKSIAESMNKMPSPGTLGILTDPSHPLFKEFPTEFHTDWQWWNIVKNSRPMILDDLPENYLPIVQVIDNVERNHKLGLIYEIRGTKGKILVCTSDLFACKEEPEVTALFASMLNYLSKKSDF